MSKKVKAITRAVTVASYVWAADIVTINTSAVHGLITGDTISFTNPNDSSIYRDVVITVTDTDTFTIAMLDRHIRIPTTLNVDVWNTGAIGTQDVFTFGFSGESVGLVQITSSSSAASTGVKVEGSLDGTHWKDVASAAALVANDSLLVTIDKPYAYGRINFVGAITGAGGKVKAYLSV